MYRLTWSSACRRLPSRTRLTRLPCSKAWRSCRSISQNDTGGRNSPLAYNFSNSNGLMSQQAQVPGNGEYRPDAGLGAGGSLGPEIGDAGKSEDLFVFTVSHVSLKRGERMVLPITEFTLPYKDVFTLELPFGPPPEVRGNLNNEQQRELARLFNAPKVMHKIRLINN